MLLHDAHDFRAFGHLVETPLDEMNDAARLGFSGKPVKKPSHLRS